MSTTVRSRSSVTRRAWRPSSASCPAPSRSSIDATSTCGRVTIEPDLTLPGHPEVVALGDMVRVRSRHGGVQELLGVAPVAMQQGRFAAKLVRARLEGQAIGPFRYQGNLATIGRAHAVADLHPIRLSGFPAWAAWLAVHLLYLIGFQNRLLVPIRWFISFVTRGRGARLITNTPAAEADRQPRRSVEYQA
jgi:NADH:quinone reductase (non-electrogenic)